MADLAGRLRDPKRRLADIRIALDDTAERMRISLDHLRQVRRQEYINLTVRLEHRNPRSRIAEEIRLVDTLEQKIRSAWERGDVQRRNRMRSAAALLETLSPLACLNRGYSITRRLPDGLILRRAASVRPGERIAVRLAAGSLHAQITEIIEEQPNGQGEV